MKLLKAIVIALAAVIAVPAANAALPSVKVKDIKGRTIDTATLNNNGKPMIISFWASWCHPCIRELNAIAEHIEDWQDETGVKMIAISIDKSQDVHKSKTIINNSDWDYSYLFDENSAFMHALGIQMPPHLLIIDGNGKIVESRSGYSEGSETHIIEKLREISAKKAPKPVKAKAVKPAKKK